jgi:hypothetical protein
MWEGSQVINNLPTSLKTEIEAYLEQQQKRVQPQSLISKLTFALKNKISTE